MSRKINRLNARKVATVTEIGRHADGGNLYLSISPNGGRRWTFLFRWHGKHKEIGFGSARDVSLARARELATEARARLAEGIAPAGSRRPTEGTTFGECADRYIEAHRSGWRSAKHLEQWTMTLRDHAAPLRRLPVSAITTEDVLTVLRPLWSTAPETASRLRGRIERVLDAAKAKGLRQGENPARWRGHLDQLLAKRPRLAKVHFAAMPYAYVPAFMQRLRSRQSMSALALEFAILTAARPGEVIGAHCEEFDLENALWIIPGLRMKGGREHHVPLSPRAVEIVQEAMLVDEGELVFAGQKKGKPMTPGALSEALRRMGVTDATAHGFRSSFRDWAGDCTHYPRDVVEAALAHAIENPTEAAYRRSTAIDKRRELMKDWAKYCAAPNVIPIRAKDLPA